MQLVLVLVPHLKLHLVHMHLLDYNHYVHVLRYVLHVRCVLKLHRSGQDPWV